MLLVALLSSALAGAPMTEFLGWTGDGLGVAYVGTDEHEAYGGDEEEGESAAYTLASVARRDGASAREIHFLLKREVRSGNPPLSTVGPVYDAKAFEAWKAVQPLAKGGAGPEGAGARITVAARALGHDPDAGPEPSADDLGAWSDGVYRAKADDMSNARYTVSLAVGTSAWPLGTFELAGGGGTMPSGRCDVHVRWAPDDQTLALVLVYPHLASMRGTTRGHTEVRFFRLHPRVEIVAHPSIRGAAVPPLEERLAGWNAMVHVKDAQKAREASVVYYKEGFEADARQMAGYFVPGGATVEPLTWESNADVVVALGASALPK